jgi:hypothetical protein
MTRASIEHMDGRTMEMTRGVFLVNCYFNAFLRLIADDVPEAKQGKSLEEILLVREGYKPGS